MTPELEAYVQGYLAGVNSPLKGQGCGCSSCTDMDTEDAIFFYEEWKAAGGHAS